MKRYEPLPHLITCGSLFLLLTLWLPLRLSASGTNLEADQPAVLGFSSRAMPGGAPEGWTLQRYRGEPVMTMPKDEDHFYLRMISSGDAAFGIRKEVSIDLGEYPFLNWRWRVNRFPQGGDIRQADKDDQAMQLYLIFKTSGAVMAFQKPALAYIWDSEAPKGLIVKSPQRLMSAVRYVVVKSGADAAGQWHREKRNIFNDRQRAFQDVRKGQPLGPIQGMLLFINTHHTKGVAEADIGELYFSRE